MLETQVEEHRLGLSRALRAERTRETRVTSGASLIRLVVTGWLGIRALLI